MFSSIRRASQPQSSWGRSDQYLLDEVCELKDRLLAMLDRAEAARDNRTFLSAIKEARGLIELQAKLLGDLKDAKVNVGVQVGFVSLEVLATLERGISGRMAEYERRKAAGGLVPASPGEAAELPGCP